MSKHVETLYQTQKALSAFLPKSGLLQRKCACGGSPGIDGECAECRSKRLSSPVRASNAVESPTVVPVVYEVLDSPGQPLDPGTKAAMQPHFGHDFSKVRVHTDEKAAESAQSLNALAYTAGRDIVFGRGQYEPATAAGRSLLGHELTHVVQQGASHTSNTLNVSHPTDTAEREAEAIAQLVPQETYSSALVQKEGERGLQGIDSNPHSTHARSPWNEFSVRSQIPMTIARKTPTGKEDLSEEEKTTSTSSKYEREVNIPQGYLETIADEDTHRVYRVVGFDIGSSDVNKPGIREALDSIIDEFAGINDANPQMNVIGFASRSRLPGKGGMAYGLARAEAIKKYFASRGISWVTTSSLGDYYAPPESSSPYVKVVHRSAVIEIRLTGKPKEGAGFGEQAPRIPKHPKGPTGLKYLKPPTDPEGAFKKIVETQIQFIKELGWANEAGAAEMLRNYYGNAFVEAITDLTEADPENRRLDFYVKQHHHDVEEIKRAAMRHPVGSGPEGVAGSIKALNMIVETAHNDGRIYVIGLGPRGAKALRDKYPSREARRKALKEMWDQVQAKAKEASK